MPDDVGGQPFPDGEEPEYRDHGAADDEFASVVLDEDFVRAAEVHEPSAAERILASAQSHAELTEGDSQRLLDESAGYARAKKDFPPDDPADDEPCFDDDPEDEGRFDRSEYREYGPHGVPPELEPAYEHGADFGYLHGAHGPRAGGGGRPYRGHRSWQRPVAWVLAVVMGIGVVALAFSAVYRGASNQRQEPAPPPATSGVEPTSEPDALPSVSAGSPGG
ncbi:hypothetical protein [Streptomyces albus]|uniref:SCO2584 family spore wall biosynthesis protein n=1 Tax=Streptomyces albus TaxID=1888 RepID=UPI003F1D550C